MNKRYAGLLAALLAAVVSVSACSDQQTVASAPVIASFSADPGTTAVERSEVSLSWEIQGSATSLTIEPDIGAVTGSSIRVAPTETTTYTLTAGNRMGSSSAQTTVTVPEKKPPLDTSTSNDALFGLWAFEITGQAGTAIAGELIVDTDFVYDGTSGVYGYVTDCEGTKTVCAQAPLGGFIHEPGSDRFRFGLSDENLELLFTAEDTDGKLSVDTRGRPLLEGEGVVGNDEPGTFRVYKVSN